MPYGVPDSLWRQLPPEDQNEIINEYYKAQVVPSIGGFAPAPPPPEPTPAPAPAPVPASVAAADLIWAWVRSLNSFPGNHPYFADDKAKGIGGYMLNLDDPYLAYGAEACRQAGFAVGVWSDPHGEDATTWGNKLVTAAHSIGAVAVSPDPEATGKGYPGSPQWQWQADAAAAIRGADGSITIIVTPTPRQDDFNYAAWTQDDSVIWVQAYGEHLTDVEDPATIVARLEANGVPRRRIGILIPAGSLADMLPKIQALGITHWGVYTIDDITPGDRTVPFGDGAPPSDVPPPPSEPVPDDSPVDDETDFGLDDVSAYELPDPDQPINPEDEPDDLGDTWADLAPSLLATGDRTLEGVRTLAASKAHGPKPPQAVVTALYQDIYGHRVPANIAYGMRVALIVVQKGIPYVWGGSDPNRGLDCSGYSQYVLRAAGFKRLARVTYDQARQGRRVDPAHRQPLDLVFFHPDSRGPGHVGIYMAAGWAVHEPHPGEVAQWLQLSTYQSMFTRRYFPDIHPGAVSQSPGSAPSTSHTINLDDVSGAWHDLMHTADAGRHGLADSVRSIASGYTTAVK